MIVYIYIILLAVPKHISWKREAKLQKKKNHICTFLNYLKRKFFFSLCYGCIMKGHRFCMSLKCAIQILYERCYRCIMREATDSL